MHVQVSKPISWTGVTETESDKLWYGVRRGDEEALGKLFCLYYSHLFNYGYKIVSNEALVKDAIQELFLALWRKHDNVSEAFSVKSYLFSSLRRILIRNLRGKKNRNKRNRIYVSEFSEEIYNVEELMIHFEIEQEKKERLIEAIQSLSNRQKEAIYLKFYAGATNQEIAHIMEINQQSVYNHVSRAIENLKNFVK